GGAEGVSGTALSISISNGKRERMLSLAFRSCTALPDKVELAHETQKRKPRDWPGVLVALAGSIRTR
ncbi:hypothetical protein V2A87_44500, partial [Pseudomonas aeruginosa]